MVNFIHDYIKCVGNNDPSLNRLTACVFIYAHNLSAWQPDDLGTDGIVDLMPGKAWHTDAQQNHSARDRWVLGESATMDQ